MLPYFCTKTGQWWLKMNFKKKPLWARKLFGSFETVLRKCTPGWRKNSRLNNHSVLKYKELRFCQIRSRIGLGKSHTVRIENSSIVEGSIAERSAFYLQLSAFNLPPSPYSWNHSQTTTSHYFAGVCTAPKVGFLHHQLGLWKRV